MDNLAASAVYAEYGEEIRSVMDRKKVLADYAMGNVDYHFEFLRRRNDGSTFWGSTSLRSCLNPETGDIIVFFYTLDITEQKLQEQLLDRIVELDYDIITEIDILQQTHRPVSCDERCKDTVPNPGIFQKEIRIVADRFMDDKLSLIHIFTALIAWCCFMRVFQLHTAIRGLVIWKIHPALRKRLAGEACKRHSV